jgi:predicted dehydrogenase
MLQPDAPWQDERAAGLERDTLFIEQANRFLDAVQGKCAPLCTLNEGMQTLRCNLAALESVKSRAWQCTGAPMRPTN